MISLAEPHSWRNLVRSLSEEKPLNTTPNYVPPLLDVTSRSEWAEQARQDRQLFSTIAPLMELHADELKWVFDEQTVADLQEFLRRIDEASIRYRLAVATLELARPVVSHMVEGMAS
jgi:hypothetical protein